MPRIVINKCYGGFHLSEAAYEWLIELGVPVRPYAQLRIDEIGDSAVIYDLGEEIPLDAFWRKMWGRYRDGWFEKHRDDPLLVWVVEQMGAAANGPCAELAIVEIPDDVKWEIQEDNGNEWVAEVHRTWE